MDCGDPPRAGEDATVAKDCGDPHSLSLGSGPGALPDGRVTGDSGSIADAKLANGAGLCTAPARSKMPYELKSAHARR